MIAGASFAIGVDTGLVHIAAALGVPLVAIFVDSEPGLTGPMGRGPIAVVGGKGKPPNPAEVLHALDGVIQRGPP
jgi:heptosyltransferase-1